MQNIQFRFDTDQFNRLFPFYILIDAQVKIISLGKSLEKVSDARLGNSFNDVFIVKRPETTINKSENFNILLDQLIVIESHAGKKVSLRGQFEYLPAENMYLFIGTPWYGSMEDVKDHDLSINDFALHDPMIDLLHVLKTHEITNEELKLLLNTVHIQRNELREANKEIHDIALLPMQSPDPIIRINLEGEILQMNPVAEQLGNFEYDHEHYDAKDLFRHIINKIGESDGRFVFEARSGNCDYSFVCIILDEERYINIYGRDITDQKINEQELQRLSLVASANENGVLFTNEEGKITWCNEGFKKMTGYTNAEVIGQTPLDLCEGPLSKSEELEKMVTAFFEGKSFSKELIHYRKDNTWFWGKVTGQAITDQTGKILRYFAIIENITYTKEAEQSIKIKEEKYRNIIANMHLGLLEVNMDETIQFANQSFCEMSGYSIDELLGHKATELLVRGENHKLVESKKDIRKEGVSDVYEVSILNKKGEPKWWLISGAPRYDDGGELKGSIGIHLDITKQKELELQLIEAKVLAESATNAKQIFLANMSHEIRTPMNAILGMSRQLQKTKLDEQQNLYLKTINDASENLLVVINDILDNSKIEAGKLTLNYIGFQMREIIKRAIQVIQNRAEEKGIALVSSVEEKIADVLMGDPFRLHQVMLNLLSNAVKFSEKGSIEIHATLLTAESNRQMVKLVITDHGIGMDKEFMKSLFESFTQEDRTASRKYEGTGLGMVITKQLVELMGGQIGVESKKHVGTTVTLEIPFTIGSTVDLPARKNNQSDSRILKGKKILLVENNEMNRLVAVTTLARYEVEISDAWNGLEAVTALKKSDYDLVLMDIQMPVMDGLEATRVIRKDLKSKIPIIALTANAIRGENEKCLEAGMDDYISKPFEEDELVHMMVKWIEMDRAEESLPTQPAIHPLYDLAKIKEISAGNKDFVHKMAILCMEQLPASMADMLAAFDASNFASIKSVAHHMKSTIDYMGIHILKNDIRRIEVLALENQHSEELTQLMQHLEQVVLDVTSALGKEFTL